MALLRSAATVGFYTLVSRVMGFVREVLTANYLGAGPVADAFFVALRLPNLFRSLFAEGAFNAAFVPLFAGTIAERGRVAAKGFAQSLWRMVPCGQAGMARSLPMPRLTPEVKRLLKLMLPGTFGAGVTQLNLVVSTAIASLLPTGAVAYLNYADRLNQLPLALVGIAVGTAILPSLSRQVRTGDAAGAIHTQNPGL